MTPKQLSRVEEANSIAIGGFTIPEGDRKLSVYVYDGRPVDGVVGPAKFVIAPGTISMTSIYTGTKWRENCAVYAGGKPIGFMFHRHPESDVKELATRYGHAVVSGRVSAPSCQGEWPTVILDLPRKSWFDEALDRNVGACHAGQA
jgi:hypothetical protein